MITPEETKLFYSQTILLNILLQIDDNANFENAIIFGNSTTNELQHLEGNKTVIIMDPEMTNTLYPRFRLHKSSLTVIYTSGLMDPVMEVAKEILRGFRTCRTVFILQQEIEGSLRQIFDWIWRHQFINSLILYGNETWSYDPFPTIQLVNLTDKNIEFPFKLPLQKGFYNLKGYTLNAPVLESFPRLFFYKDRNATVISGINGYTFLQFLKFMNMTWNGWDWLARYNETQLSYYALSLKTDTLAEMSVTTTIRMWSEYDVSESFPTYIVDACYMVPVKNALPSYLYIKRPFSSSLWLLLGFSVFPSTLIFYIFSKFWFYGKNHKEIFIHFKNSFSAMLYSPIKVPPNIPKWSIFFAYFSLFYFGFMINSYYNTYLSAFLTTVLYDDEIKTIQDLMKSDIKILSTKEQALHHMDIGKFPKDFMNTFEVVDDSHEKEILHYRDTFNTSYGYFVTSDLWFNYFRRRQGRLRNKLFKWTNNICIARYYVTYPMLYDSHLTEPFKYFSMSCQMYGLFEGWSYRSFKDALRMKIVEVLDEKKLNDFKTLQIDFFRIGWCILLTGLSLAFLVFVIEVLKNCNIIDVVKD